MFITFYNHGLGWHQRVRKRPRLVRWAGLSSLLARGAPRGRGRSHLRKHRREVLQARRLVGPRDLGDPPGCSRREMTVASEGVLILARGTPCCPPVQPAKEQASTVARRHARAPQCFSSLSSFGWISFFLVGEASENWNRCSELDKEAGENESGPGEKGEARFEIQARIPTCSPDEARISRLRLPKTCRPAVSGLSLKEPPTTASSPQTQKRTWGRSLSLSLSVSLPSLLPLFFPLLAESSEPASRTGGADTLAQAGAL